MLSTCIAKMREGKEKREQLIILKRNNVSSKKLIDYTYSLPYN